jgi:hypothetical protein
MNQITRHDIASPPATELGPHAARSVRHPAPLIRQRVHATLVAAGILGTVAVAAVLVGSSLPASAVSAQSTPGAAWSPTAPIDGNGRLEATFTARPVSVTPGSSFTVDLGKAVSATKMAWFIVEQALV